MEIDTIPTRACRIAAIRYLALKIAVALRACASPIHSVQRTKQKKI